jgi:hypothetical protein
MSLCVSGLIVGATSILTRHTMEGAPLITPSCCVGIDSPHVQAVLIFRLVLEKGTTSASNMALNECIRYVKDRNGAVRRQG